MEILQLLLYGIILGSILSLGAIGVSLTFGILRFANFSHGDLMTIGAYVTLVVFGILKMPFWIGFIVALVVTAALAVLIDKLLYRNFRRSQPIILLISSFGVALILRSLIQLIWGPDNQVFEQGIQIAQKFAGLRIKPDQITILVGTAVLVIALHLFLQKTKVGKAMRAVADNAELARLTGIDTEKVIMWTWVMGGALAAAAGIFLGLDTRLFPEMGWNILLPVFAAAILGGIGNPYGAVAGGIIIGIAQEMSTLFLDPAYKPAIAFALMVVILIVRPTGIFAGRST
ncbi:branched-chain amino acid ABC transporter permease [Aestuariispira ectoiniformans]|uniref:branched-chain amino acid ABC transporter permease n=1 Tax=Aestuariispira ectoiniformans TaxID=2775080 RepID=UPI00223B80AA|nr:branched-chain amino acid ABC transporter permease [Aestuariispira ectoiniformans]